MTPSSVVPPAAGRDLEAASDRRLDAVQRLASIRSLRTYLRGLERNLVQQARREGRSWQELGDALDISRQAAQQRFRRIR